CAEALALPCEVTWAPIPAADGSGCQTKWNWSEVLPAPAPPPPRVQVPVFGSNDWLPAGSAPPMAAEVQLAGEASVHLTRDGKAPTVVTLATTTSSPSPDPGKVKEAWPFTSVTAEPVSPASGPLFTAKLTVALGSPVPPPSSSVAVSVTCWPVTCVTVAGPRA